MRPRSPRSAITAAVIAALVFAACGPGEEATPAGAPSQPGARQAPQPGSGPAPAPVPRTAPEDLTRNDNGNDGSFSSICWARWEVARHQLQISSSKADAAKADAAEASLEASLPAIEDALRRSESRATGTVRTFVVQFRDAAGRARADMARGGAERHEAASRHFDWETFPGMKDYGVQSQNAPGCVRP